MGQGNHDGRGWRDMGGRDAGPVPREGRDFALWEKRVDALMVLCPGRGPFTVDGLRRALEDMAEPPAVAPAPPAPFAVAGLRARFAAGDVVRVRRGDGPGHIRTP